MVRVLLNCIQPKLDGEDLCFSTLGSIIIVRYRDCSTVSTKNTPDIWSELQNEIVQRFLGKLLLTFSLQ